MSFPRKLRSEERFGTPIQRRHWQQLKGSLCMAFGEMLLVEDLNGFHF